MMNHVHICYVIETHANGKEQRGARTVATFIGGTDEARAQYLAGAAADAWHDATGVAVQWHVESLPYVRTIDEGALLRYVRELAAGSPPADVACPACDGDGVGRYGAGGCSFCDGGGVVKADQVETMRALMATLPGGGA